MKSCFATCPVLVSFLVAAPAQARTLKNTFSHGGYCTCRFCTFLCAAKNKRVGDNLPPKQRMKVDTKNKRKRNTEKQQNINDVGDIVAPKTDPKGVRKQLPTPSWLQERLGRFLGSIVEPLGVILEAQNGAETQHMLEAVLDGIFMRLGGRRRGVRDSRGGATIVRVTIE